MELFELGNIPKENFCETKYTNGKLVTRITNLRDIPNDKLLRLVATRDIDPPTIYDIIKKRELKYLFSDYRKNFDDISRIVKRRCVFRDERSFDQRKPSMEEIVVRTEIDTIFARFDFSEEDIKYIKETVDEKELYLASQVHNVRKVMFNPLHYAKRREEIGYIYPPLDL